MPKRFSGLFVTLLFSCVIAPDAFAQPDRDEWRLASLQDLKYVDIDCATDDSCFAIAYGDGPSSIVQRVTLFGGRIEISYIERARPGNPFPVHFRFFDIAYPTSAVALVACDSGMVLRTSDAGRTWAYHDLNSSMGLIEITMSDELHGFVRSTRELWMTSDGGLNWDTVSFPPGVPRQTSRMYSPEPGVLIMRFGSVDLGIYLARTTDSGRTWSVRANPPRFSSMSFIDRNVGWGVGSGPGRDSVPWVNDVIYRTVDGGMTWETQVDTMIDEARGLRSVAFLDASNGFAVGGGAKILRTTDGGANWVKQSTGLANVNIQPLIAVAYPSRSNAYTISTLGHLFVNFVLVSSLRDQSELTNVVTVFPNPLSATTQAYAQVDLKAEGSIELASWNIRGEAIQRKLLGAMPAGRHTILLDEILLSAGAAFVTLYSDGLPLQTIPIAAIGGH